MASQTHWSPLGLSDPLVYSKPHHGPTVVPPGHLPGFHLPTGFRWPYTLPIAQIMGGDRSLLNEQQSAEYGRPPVSSLSIM